MLRLMAPKNLDPLKENMFDFREASSVVDAYIIPALKVDSGIKQVSQPKKIQLQWTYKKSRI